MIAGIASLIFIPLLAIAMVHVMWAFGSTWPVSDQKTLARTVTGFKSVERMPPRLLSALVAVLALVAGIWALSLSGPERDPMLVGGGVLLGLVFLARGIAGFTAWWRCLTPEEPFATFDKKVYSPLSLCIGLGFLFLTIWRFL